MENKASLLAMAVYRYYTFMLFVLTIYILESAMNLQMGVITHEVGHALGLWHEQSRPDADGYVRIIPDNVIDGLLYNFLQRSWGDVLTYNVPYDLGSVMHYGGTVHFHHLCVCAVQTICFPRLFLSTLIKIQSKLYSQHIKEQLDSESIHPSMM